MCHVVRLLLDCSGGVGVCGCRFTDACQALLAGGGDGRGRGAAAAALGSGAPDRESGAQRARLASGRGCSARPPGSASRPHVEGLMQRAGTPRRPALRAVTSSHSRSETPPRLGSRTTVLLLVAHGVPSKWRSGSVGHAGSTASLTHGADGTRSLRCGRARATTSHGW